MCLQGIIVFNESINSVFDGERPVHKITAEDTTALGPIISYCVP